MKPLIILLLAFTITLNCFAQEKTVESYSYFSTGFKQIKESANFGLVFNGPILNYGHYLEFSKNNRTISIENEVGVCIPFSKGIPALNVYLKPIEISYLFNNTISKNSFSVGPLVKFEYDYTLYPQLQSAFDYWFTNFSLGVNSSCNFKIKSQHFYARLKSTLCGFTSRQPDYRNPYFYDIGFKHAIRHLNTDLEFSALNKYNVTNFEIAWKPKAISRLIWAYSFNYSGYFEKPAITMVSHTLKLTLNSKK